MDEKTIRPLKIEPKFKNLIRPLQRKEYLQLEQNILSDGCRDPIITWNGVIVDGHNRYEYACGIRFPLLSLRWTSPAKRKQSPGSAPISLAEGISPRKLGSI